MKLPLFRYFIDPIRKTLLNYYQMNRFTDINNVITSRRIITVRILPSSIKVRIYLIHNTKYFRTFMNGIYTVVYIFYNIIANILLKIQLKTI